ncbi:DUF4105 domain-containing protein [Atlantibacter sp.]|uniref:Lnb N-terminal periplasmic domain-containing protein n=1 Tax=Atlantibacter sp. TaxID=1903473 RepID=UPI0028AABC56|nr:DUF4105 domain-containing protein [Atlantibacter sp.]
MLKKLFYRDNNKIHWLHGYEEKPEILFGSDNRFTIKNFRNAAMIDNTLCFDWQDKTLNLDDISSVDLVISYWSSRHIAHVFLSFGFGSGEYVAISIETRRQASQKYSTWKGFFNTYELIYVVADERDLIGIRANVRKEDVYIYRVNVTKEVCKQVFLDYALRINSLKNNDEFYHTINNNCTTNILRHSRKAAPDFKYNWMVLFSGHVDQYCYDLGLLDKSLTIEELRANSKVALVLESLTEDYSQLIRPGHPKP